MRTRILQQVLNILNLGRTLDVQRKLKFHPSNEPRRSEMADVIPTTRRRLWWRHLLSFLVAPVVMTVLIPLSIAGSTGVRAPELTTPGRIGLAVIGGLLMVVGLGLLIWTVVLFDR